MTNTMAGSYYVLRKAKLLGDFDKAAKIMSGIVASRYGAGFADEAIRESRREYEALIPELPYIGGRKNRLTEALVSSAWPLALYRTFKRRGKLVEETGRVINELVEARLRAYPRLLLYAIGRYRFSGCFRSKLRREAALRQKRKYAGDWVTVFVEGDGIEFDYGIDYTECGICKLFRARNADELIPFMCLTDFPVSRKLGTGLVRTTTLADGFDRCDFRFKRGREVKQGWP